MNTEWRELDDATLEQLLVERWLFRGALVAAMLGGAGLTTYLGTRGLTTLAEQVEVAGLAVLTLAAAVWLFLIRRRDHEIHRELWRRRKN